MTRFRRVDPPGSRGWLLELRLTPRQREAVRAVFLHGSMKGAAASLDISLQTMKNHLRDVHRALDVTSTFDVARELWLADLLGWR